MISHELNRNKNNFLIVFIVDLMMMMDVLEL